MRNNINLQNNNAQGTVEYLIIIAIIIVIGLIVAGISTNMFQAQQITQTTNQLKGQIGTNGISITDAITNTTDNNGFLNFKNNTGETITLTKIIVDNGELNDYNNKQIYSGNNELIQLNHTCECESNQKTKTCEFQITYKTKYGLEQKIKQSITVQCEENIEPIKEPIIPIPEDEEIFPPGGIDLIPFIFQIEITENDQEFKFQIDDAHNIEIDWNLGSGWEDLVDGNALRTKKYPTAGTYYLKLRGRASRVAFGAPYSTPALLKDILTPVYGGISTLTSAERMFSEATELINPFTATNFFDEASIEITNMQNMFIYSNFNQDISNWHVDKVTNMADMFSGESSWGDGKHPFNQNISSWNTSNVTNLSGMFNNSNFNQDISTKIINEGYWDEYTAWDVSNVKDMSYTFSGSSFNQNIGNWNVSSVIDMSAMFGFSSFNQNISEWNVSNVTTCEMFKAMSSLNSAYVPAFTCDWSSPF
ncbi:MAG: BspA family leucine-rich repeat surface protein [Candidatus ainarchaeum sp.]|nr:BspA family leucine-rich repeat surface protein [Candidatus ainarchaeum sp.]